MLQCVHPLDNMTSKEPEVKITAAFRPNFRKLSSTRGRDVSYPDRLCVRVHTGLGKSHRKTDYLRRGYL